MIPVLADAGFRVIASDNLGFGKSDKPLKVSDHSYQMHIDVMANFVDELALKDVTLFAQDWGGAIRLRVVVERPSQFSRVMISNSTLAGASGIKGWLPLFRAIVWREGEVKDFDFPQWVAYARLTDKFDFANVFQGGSTRTLSDADLAGYAAPYPSNEYIAGIRIFPQMVATQLRQNHLVMEIFSTI